MGSVLCLSLVPQPGSHGNRWGGVGGTPDVGTVQTPKAQVGPSPCGYSIPSCMTFSPLALAVDPPTNDSSGCSTFGFLGFLFVCLFLPVLMLLDWIVQLQLIGKMVLCELCEI